MSKKGIKYKVTLYFPDSTEDDYELEDLYDTEEEATEAALNAMNDFETGAEVLYLSDPVENPYDEDEGLHIEYDIEEVDVQNSVLPMITLNTLTDST